MGVKSWLEFVGVLSDREFEKSGVKCVRVMQIQWKRQLVQFIWEAWETEGLRNWDSAVFKANYSALPLIYMAKVIQAWS